MPDPGWRWGWVDSGEVLGEGGVGEGGGEWALSLRRCEAAPECGMSVLRVSFCFLQFSVELPSSLRVLGNVHSTCVWIKNFQKSCFFFLTAFAFHFYLSF